MVRSRSRSAGPTSPRSGGAVRPLCLHIVRRGANCRPRWQRRGILNCNYKPLYRDPPLRSQLSPPHKERDHRRQCEQERKQHDVRKRPSPPHSVQRTGVTLTVLLLPRLRTHRHRGADTVSGALLGGPNSEGRASGP
jgi:hypothetical protein